MRLLALLLLPALLGAQRPSWDVWRRTQDQFGPWELSGPRVGIQAVRAGVGAETYRALRATGLRPALAAPAGALLSGALPHVVGVARGRYPFDGADWAADLAIAGGSAYVARAFERKRRRVLVTTLYAAGWALAAGWASP